MSHPNCPSIFVDLIDEHIDAGGEPFEDGLGIIAYVLERALNEARGGYGRQEAIELVKIADFISETSDVQIDYDHDIVKRRH